MMIDAMIAPTEPKKIAHDVKRRSADVQIAFFSTRQDSEGGYIDSETSDGDPEHQSAKNLAWLSKAIVSFPANPNRDQKQSEPIDEIRKHRKPIKAVALLLGRGVAGDA